MSLSIPSSSSFSIDHYLSLPNPQDRLLCIYHCIQPIINNNQINCNSNYNNINSVVESILQHDPSIVNQCYPDGCTLLHWLMLSPTTYLLLPLLLQSGIDINQAGGQYNELPLMWAIRGQHKNAMLAKNIYAYLVSEYEVNNVNSCNVNHQNSLGQDALQLACQYGLISTVYLLLIKGASPLSIDQSGCTALHHVLSSPLVSSKQRLSLVRLLLHYSVNIDQADNDGNTVMHTLFLNVHGSDASTLFIAYYLLEARERSLAIVSSGNNSNFSNALKLITTSSNREGLTPVEIALSKKSPQLRQFIFDYKQYKSYPKWLPLAASAASMWSYPLMFYLGGTIIGAFANIIIYWLYSTYCRQSTILKDISRTSVGWTWGILGCLTIVHILYTIQFVSIFSSCIFFALLFGTIILFVNLNVRKPASLSPSDCNRDELAKRLFTDSRSHLALGRSDVDLRAVPAVVGARDSALDIESNDGSNSAIDVRGYYGTADSAEEKLLRKEWPSSSRQAELCCACIVDRSLASTHCKHCDACFVALDHHCHFINNCVGRGNRRLFFWFTVFASSFGYFAALLDIWALQHLYCDPASELFHADQSFSILRCSFTNFPALLWDLLLAFAAATWIVSLAANQLYLVGIETTTYYQLKGQVVPKETYCLEWRHFKNMGKFLRTGSYTVSLPEVEAVQVIASGTYEATALLDDVRREELESEIRLAAYRQSWWHRTKAKIFNLFGSGQHHSHPHGDCQSCNESTHISASPSVVYSNFLTPQQPVVVIGKVIAVSAPSNLQDGELKV